MPRIAFLAFYPLSPNRIGGMDRFFWRLDRYARQSGWQITWLFPAGGDHSHYVERGISIVPLPVETFMDSASEYFAGSPGFDLLVSVFVEYATRYAIKWRFSGVRHYLALDHMSRRVRRRSAATRLKERARGMAAYPFVDAVLTVCSFVTNDVISRLGRQWRTKLFTVANGVDGEVYYPADGEGQNNHDALRMLAISHLIEEKGIQVFLRALCSVRKRLPNFSVSIAGSGPYENTLRGMAAELGLTQCVEFVGSTSRQSDLLRTADVSVVPSLWAEAFPFSVLESMACGVPVIASRIGGMPEMVGKEAAILVTPGSVEELAASLVSLADDSSLRRRMGQAGTRRVKEIYTIEHMLGGYVSVMRRLLSEGQVSGSEEPVVMSWQPQGREGRV